MEHLVGDILVTNEEFPGTISPINLLARRVAQLLPENHNRIVDIQRIKNSLDELDKRVSELEGVRHSPEKWRDRVSRWLEKRSNSQKRS